MSRMELARRLFEALQNSKNGRVDLRKWSSVIGESGADVNGAYKILLNRKCAVKRGQVEVEYVGREGLAFEDLFETLEEGGDVNGESTADSASFAETVHSALRHEIMRLKSQMSALETQRDNMQGLINRLRDDYEEAMQMGGEAEDRAQEYARQVDRLRLELDSAGAAQVGALEERVREAEEARAKAESLQEDAESELSDLHAVLEGKEAEIARLQEAASEQESGTLSLAESLGMQRQIRDLEAEKASLSARLGRVQRELEEERARKAGAPAKDPVAAILDMERLGFSGEQMRKVYATYMRKHLDVDIDEALS